MAQLSVPDAVPAPPRSFSAVVAAQDLLGHVVDSVHQADDRGVGGDQLAVGVEQRGLVLKHVVDELAVVGTDRVWVVRGRRELPLEVGAPIAVHAVGGSATGVRTRGLAFEMDGEDLEPMVARGIANRIIRTSPDSRTWDRNDTSAHVAGESVHPLTSCTQGGRRGDSPTYEWLKGSWPLGINKSRRRWDTRKCSAGPSCSNRARGPPNRA